MSVVSKYSITDRSRSQPSITYNPTVQPVYSQKFFFVSLCMRRKSSAFICDTASAAVDDLSD